MSEFQKSFAVVNLFYEQLEYTLITETQAIMPMDVLNGIGGSFSLCLGGSILTMVELLILLPCFLYKKKRKKKWANENLKE